MDLSHLLVGGAAIGFITSCWSYIKATAWKFCNLFVQCVEIHEATTANAVVGYLLKNYSKSGMYDKIYYGSFEFIRDGNVRTGLVPYEIFGKRSIIFWNFVFPFIFSGPEKPKSTNTNSGITNDKSLGLAYITHLRFTLNIDKIITNAVFERNKMVWESESKSASKNRRFFIKHVPDISKDKATEQNDSNTWWFRQNHIRLLGYNEEQLGRGKDEGVSLLDALIFPKHVKLLIDEVKLWRQNREWYIQRNIPWKRGWLLYGIPGTGKTALSRAFAEDLDMPIFVFNLSEIGNFEFMRSWLTMQQNTPCIALIEDIDNVFHGRDNITSGRRGFWSMISRKKDNKSDNNKSDNNNKEEEFSGGMLSFDVLLNCLDGVERSEGVFTIITTNDISKVDPAIGLPRKRDDGSMEVISTRPGRIDKAIELTYMEVPEKKLMASRILRDYPDMVEEMLIEIDTNVDVKETPAQFQEKLSQLALARFWREMHPELFGDQYILVEKNGDNFANI